MSPVGYELYSPEGDKGGGVRATRDFRIGETVMIGMLEGEVPCNDSHATQIGRDTWARHGGLGPKVNHSCNPNCGVALNETGACDFVARKSILSGEEITFDYAMRNYSIEHFPDGCLCGADICRGSVTGWKDLSAERKSSYEGQVAPYLLEIDRELIETPV
ncbi:MAG TPA: SET domain-containing protein-lysine N-methyltransferase [Solirubrobacterales bacterium]|nr:SET domain-containing protein-lysine N-methyltransferase [Solirubrobacterales bacterium]